MISLVSISDKVNIYVDKGKQTFYGTMDEKNKLLNFIIGLNKTKGNNISVFNLNKPHILLNRICIGRDNKSYIGI